DIDIRRVITNLCVMDFGGPQHQIRLLSLHPGVTAAEVQENTGYEVFVSGDVPQPPRRSSWPSLPRWTRTTSAPTRSGTTRPE
ncbi:hypothetical protein N9M39_00770, partial [Halieaceae bacterium]|nr:hypothetical protein [Halieaceae bacterium]